MEHEGAAARSTRRPGATRLAACLETERSAAGARRWRAPGAVAALLVAAALLLAAPARAAGPTDTPAPAPTAGAATTVRPEPNVAPERPARGELTVGLGLAGAGTDWSGDGAGYGALTIGFRLWRTVTPFFGLALGYGVVDQRLLTRLTVGVEVGHTFAERLRPRLYVAFVHQHEESLAAVAREPVGWLLGIGTAIRHRAGVHAGAGLDFVILRRRTLDLGVGPDVSIDWYDPGYSYGPELYFTVGVAASAHFRVF